MQTSDGKSAAASAPKQAGRKARVPLSCGQCRYRKLKCNREQPCQNCVMRKEPSACIFSGSGNSRVASTKSHTQNMQQRIDRLENLVKSLVSQNKDKKEETTIQNITPDYSSASPPSSENTKEAHQELPTFDDIHLVNLETTHQNYQPSYNLEPDEFEANQLIETYQNETTNQSPFVVIPPGTAASDLRRDLPILYNAIIMAASSHYPARQLFYEKQVIEAVTDHLLVRNQKSLELLQSILLAITWYRRTAFIITQLNSLLQLAVALVIDLNLNSNPTWFMRSKITFGTQCSKALKYRAKTLDERRALLGCFYLSSATATCSLQRLDSIRLTSQIEESCKTLLEKAEYPTDLQLVYVVKAQYLTDRIVQNIQTNEWDLDLTSMTPVGSHIKAFQSEIAAVKASLPPSVQQNSAVLMHLDFASIRLYEVALLDNPEDIATNPIRTDPVHLETLYSLLLYTKSFITAILSTTSATNLTLSHITWAQYTYSLMILCRLTFFTSPSCPGWDIPFVRSVMDFTVVLDTFVNRLGKAGAGTLTTEGGSSVEQGDTYKKYARKMPLVKAWFEHRVKFGTNANWDWELEKRRLMNGSEANKGVDQENGAVAVPNKFTGDVAEMNGGEMQLDPSLYDGLNDECLWLELAAEWGDVGLYSNSFVGN